MGGGFVLVLEEGGGAFDEAGAEGGVGEVGLGFFLGLDGEVLGGGGVAKAGELGEDEPHPVGGFSAGAQFGEGLVVDGLLGGEEAGEVVGVLCGHGF